MKSYNKVSGRARAAVAAYAAAWIGGAMFAGAQTNSPPTADQPNSAPAEFKPLAPGEYNNWLELGAGSFFTSGDKASFQQRHQMPGGPFGGVEDFHWETPFQ